MTGIAGALSGIGSELQRRPGRWLAVAMLLAASLRLAFVLSTTPRALVGDETTYDSIAYNLVSGHGYRLGESNEEGTLTAMRGPSYVLEVALFYRIFGRTLTRPLVAQALLDVLGCWLVYQLGRLWFRRPQVGVTAAAIYAIYPPFIQYSGALLTESFTTLTLLAALLAWQVHLEAAGWRAAAGSGVALALCALNKPQLAPLIVLLPLVALPERGGARTIRDLAILALAFAVVTIPWVLRNAMVFHAFVPGVTNGGIGFWGGTAPIGGRLISSLADPPVPDSLRRAVLAMGEVQGSRWLYREGVRIIAADPGRYAFLLFRKFFQLWFNLGFDQPPSRASVDLAAFQAVAVALAAAGLRIGSPGRGVARLIGWLGLVWTAVHLPFVVVVRYAVPFYSVLFVCTAAGLVALIPGCVGPPREVRFDTLSNG